MPIKIKTANKKKAPSAPSSGKKKMAAFDLSSLKKKQDKGAKTVKAKQPFKDTTRKPKIEEGIRKASAKSAKLAKKKQPELKAKIKQREEIEKDLLAYLRKRGRPTFGNSILDADSKGKDGFDALRLLPYAAKQFKKTPEGLLKSFMNGNKDVADFLVSCAFYNMWIWNNFNHRLWVETQDMEPPIRRLVAMDIKDIFPGAEYTGVFDLYMKVISKTDKDALQATRALGQTRFKVRLLITGFQYDLVRPSSMTKLYDMLMHPQSARINLHMVATVDYRFDYSNLDRGSTVVYPIKNLRKSDTVKDFLNVASDLGFKAMLPFAAIKGDTVGTKHVKTSETYRLLRETWNGLQPLMTMPIDGNMKLLAKAATFSDILLT